MSSLGAIPYPVTGQDAWLNQTEPLAGHQKSRAHLSQVNLDGVKNSATEDYSEATIRSDPFLLLEKYELD